MARRARTNPLEARLLAARVPPGTPAGGQWVERPHEESDIDLDAGATTTVIEPLADGGATPADRTTDLPEPPMAEPTPDPATPSLGRRLLRRLTTPKLDRYREEVRGTAKAGKRDPNWHETWSGKNLPHDQQVSNAESSYTHPPFPRTAEQAAAFWMNVPIPDHVVDVAAEHCPKGTHPEIVRHLVRVSALAHTASLGHMSEPEARKVYRLGIPFPDGSVFRPKDALRWWGVEDAHRYMRLTDRSMTPWLRG